MRVTRRQIRQLIRETIYRDSNTRGKNEGVLLEELLRAEPDDIKKAAQTGIAIEYGEHDPKRLMSQIEALREAIPGATQENGWLDVYDLPGWLQNIVGYMSYDLASTDVGCAAADLVLALDEMQKMLADALAKQEQPVIDMIEFLKSEGKYHWDRVSNDFYAMADGDRSMRDIRNTTYRHLTNDELFRIAQAVDDYFNNPQRDVEGAALGDNDPSSFYSPSTRINEIGEPGLTATDKARVFNKQALGTTSAAAFDYEAPESKDFKPEPLGRKIEGGLFADPEAFVERVTKQPLKVGSRGDDVKVAQVYLVQALKVIGSKTHTMPETLTKNIQKLADSGVLTGSRIDMSGLIRDLAKKIEETGPDGVYGRLTELATRIVQDAAVSMTPGQPIIKQDGVFGRDTAITVINGFKQPTGVPDVPEQLEEGAIIGRWNRLAGLIKR